MASSLKVNRIVPSSGTNIGFGTASGQIRFAQSAKLTFDGDTNTFIERPAADTFAFTTAGTERLRIISSGNIGIGTITPGFQLDVDYNVNAEDGIRIINRGNGTSSTSMLRFGNNESATAAFLMLNSSGYNSVGGAYNLVLGHGLSNRDIVFSTAGSEKVRIKSGGSVNIGGQYTQTVHQLSVNKSNGSCIQLGNTSGTGAGSHDAQIVASDGTNFNNLKIGGHETKVFANVSGGTGYVETWRFNSSGNLQCMLSGKGIDFSATADGSGTANRSELLDDYEQGSFTPVMKVEGQSNAASTVARGLYVKVGGMVTVWIEFVFNGTPSNRTTGNAWEFHSLPFTTQSFGATPGGCNDYRQPCIVIDPDTTGTYGSNGHFLARMFDNNTMGRIEWQHSDLFLKNASLHIKGGTYVQLHMTYPSGI